MANLRSKIIDERAFVARANALAKGKVPFLFLVNFEKTAFFICALEEAARYGVLYEVKGRTNAPTSPKRNGHSTALKLTPIDEQIYGKAFRVVQDSLYAGNSYLVNLTFPTPIETTASLEELFHWSAAPYKLFFDGEFVLFSPECFVRIQDNCIFSYPMKGTIDAGVPNAASVLLRDPKERAEHITIVDLIRNDLAMVASNVEVTKFRYIDHIRTNRKNLLQVSSEIRGVLESDWAANCGSLLLRLLPAGSISGAPKAETVRIIQAAEQQERGWFTGVFGLFDGKNLDSAVNIRFVERNGEQGLQFRSGGGITIFSEEKKEYNEMLDKVYVPTF